MRNERAFMATADLEHEQVPQRRPKERRRNESPSRAKGVPYFNALTVEQPHRQDHSGDEQGST